MVSQAKLGFRSLIGCDLPNQLDRVAEASDVSIVPCDLHNTTFGTGSADVVVALSVIEHGVNIPRFLTEANRLLRQGGSLLISFDYWPSQRNMSTKQYDYGDSWRIWSWRDVSLWTCPEALALYGMAPLPSMASAWDVVPPGVVSWNGLNYTFAFIGMTKIHGL
mmetsp:Transcript_15622/g.37278  ORF Transcript_15622/g.37278 Transcript_15622/m.37278 type:complete len:164 (+) Transcript_15622:1311-1802(+)